MSTGLKVIVCDDHQVFTDALVAYLRGVPEIGSVEAVHNVDDALRRLRQGADILLLDLALEDDDQDGLTAVEAIGHLGLDVRVLVLSGSGDVNTIVRALRLGANGFCTKDVHPEQLVTAIRQVVAGDVTLPSHMTQDVLVEIQDRQTEAQAHAREMARLTPREREVLRMLSNGRDSAHIARVLELSQNTVRTHLQHIMRKLGVHSQLHAAAEGRRLFGEVLAR